MRYSWLAMVMVLGCGDVSSNSDMTAANIDMSAQMASGDMASAPDGGAGGPTLVVDNTLSWCTVTVTIGSGQPSMFSGPSMSFMAAAGTTIMLHAVPNPGFFPVKWTGVTTMNGADATYTMTSAAMQTVTACCPTTAQGGGC